MRPTFSPIVRLVSRVLIALGVLLVLPAAAPAPGVTTYTLDNGMQIVVIEDHRAPVVTHMVWYRVGSADEPQGKAGVAHFLEHLLFKGTDDLAPGEFSRIVEANGGNDNAFTSFDYTAYFQRVAADRLSLMMQLEADRMRDLVLTEDEVATERDVVLEERSSRIDSDPGGIFGEQMRAAEYLNHPYGRPIIGWRHEIEALSLDDAVSFYRTFYAPNNAILVVAGDVQPEDVLSLARTHYGPLAPTPDLPPRVRPQEPPQLAERRVIYRDARVRQPYVSRSYLAPVRASGDQSEAAALAVLAQLLGGGVTSHLVQSLQFEQGLAISAGAYYSGQALDWGSFGLYAVPAEGVTLEQVEQAMDAALAEFISNGPDEAELERVKTQIRASQIYALDNQQSRARSYGAGLTSGLSVADIVEWPQALGAITAQDVNAAAASVFDRAQSVTGYLMPEEEAK